MPQLIQINRFPTSGCEAAFRCGREFADNCLPITDIPLALSFCDTPQEETWLLIGIDYEKLEMLTAMERRR